MIKSLGNLSNMTVGWLTMIPYITGGIGLVVWGRISDRMHERRWNLLGACLVSTIGLIIAGMTMAPGGPWLACRLQPSGSMAPRARSGPCHRCS
jgi:ACS family tartrate transporter-like MFS transporter